jgi:hypothetical protein
MRIKIAIPEVVDSTSSTSHDKSPGEEECSGADDGGRCSDRRSHGGCDESTEKAWEEEVV